MTIRLNSLLLVIIILTTSLVVSTQTYLYQNHDEFFLIWPWYILTIYFANGDNNIYGNLNLSIGIFLVIASSGLLILLLSKSALKEKTSSLYGSARWSNKRDIKKAGLLSNEGVYVGAWVDFHGNTHYLRHNGPEHILTFAPTRSGKGVGLIIPTMLSWMHSSVIFDPKGELWQLTSGWRHEHAGNKVLRFEPSNSDSACWNPLNEIRVGSEFEIADIQNLANIIVDPDGKGLLSHWQKTAQSLLSGLILYLLYKCKQNKETATLSKLDSLLSSSGNSIDDLWREMLKFEHAISYINSTIINTARDMLDRSEEEASSIVSTLKSYLSLYRDPVIAKNTEKSDFYIKDLMHSEASVSLYIITEPSDKARLMPLIRVLVNMVIRVLSCNENLTQNSKSKNRLLLMLDEFPSLGRLDIIHESLAYLAGYGIKCYLICQDVSQLKSKEYGYGNDESISSNCHIQNFFTPNRLETARYISQLLGKSTICKEQVSTSRRNGLSSPQISKTNIEIARCLLTEDECLRLSGAIKDKDGMIVQPADMIITVAGFPAIKGKQILYFKDKSFSLRASIKPFDNALKKGDYL